jgi:hypothetical protein
MYHRSRFAACTVGTGIFPSCRYRQAAMQRIL